MELNAKDVFDVLVEKNIESLNHANSVITTCQFLRYGSLISRGVIERKKWRQTAQNSDEIDKEFSVWNDVFVDSVDIHERASRANIYGPVLIKIKPSILVNQYTGNLWITKSNPTKWHGTSVEERWFQSIEDFRGNFSKGTFDQMIVFRHSGGELPIKNYVQSILLDDPKIETSLEYDVFSLAFGALRSALEEGDMNDIKINKRKCDAFCHCGQHYNSDLHHMARMYAPWLLKKQK
jgi:hypothetical protein